MIISAVGVARRDTMEEKRCAMLTTTTTTTMMTTTTTTTTTTTMTTRRTEFNDQSSSLISSSTSFYKDNDRRLFHNDTLKMMNGDDVHDEIVSETPFVDVDNNISSNANDNANSIITSIGLNGNSDVIEHIATPVIPSVQKPTQHLTMVEKMDVVSVEGETGVKTSAPSARKKRPGRASKQRSSDAYRFKIGSHQHNENRERKLRSLGVLDDSCLELERSLKQMAVTVQKRAIPLPVATRGVGFCAAVEYGRMITTWNLHAIRKICTIHQYYRVSLYLAYFKMFQARYGQNDMPTFAVGVPFTLSEELRQVLVTVTQVPVTTANLLSSIGRIEASVVFHSLPVQVDLANAEECATYIYPTNVRQSLELLANPESPAPWRNEFLHRNSIPGLRLGPPADGAPVAVNIDDVYPVGYTVADLQRDVYAYSSLLTRVSGRLPKSFISTVEWGSVGSMAGLTCFDPLPTRLISQFERAQHRPQPGPARKTKRMDGCPDLHPPAPLDEYTYVGDVYDGSPMVCEAWSLESGSTAMDLALGVASHVGERAAWQTRLQVNGRAFAHLAPGSVVYAMVDAPRPKA